MMEEKNNKKLRMYACHLCVYDLRVQSDSFICFFLSFCSTAHDDHHKLWTEGFKKRCDSPDWRAKSSCSRMKWDHLSPVLSVDVSLTTHFWSEKKSRSYLKSIIKCQKKKYNWISNKFFRVLIFLSVRFSGCRLTVTRLALVLFWEKKSHRSSHKIESSLKSHGRFE